jgi:acetyltransferase
MNSLESFFNPQVTAVVGVSSEPTKLGTAIFKNLIDSSYEGTLYAINPKYAGQKFLQKDCYSSVRDLPLAPDLVIVVVPAKLVMAVIDDCILKKTKNISIITAGFSEVGDHHLESQIADKCQQNHINLLGPNCLGHISTFHKLNASFASGFPQKGNIAFISQSGAYCAAMLDWARERGVGFSHFISIGNKAVLSENELLEALGQDPQVKAFVLYLESLKDGKRFMKIARDLVPTKPIVVLEPGKSSRAQAASLSHTGSLAPNYSVLEEAFREVGILQAHDTREMFGLLEILQHYRWQNFDGKLGIITNAGGVGVLASDLCEANGLDMPVPSDATIEKLKTLLPAEAALGNPLDIIGDATADRYQKALQTLCTGSDYKNLLVLLTPQMITDATAIAKVIVALAQKYKSINIFTSFVGGEKVREGIQLLQQNHLLNFDYPTDATRLLGLLRKKNLKPFSATVKFSTIPPIPDSIKNTVNAAVKQQLKSLPQHAINMILQHYQLDHPKSGNYTKKNEALKFCRQIFPHPVVVKLSHTAALHKTEMKGVYLDIRDENTFVRIWEELQQTIEVYQLAAAEILVQEMIFTANEAFVGINSDKNFGKVLVFGTGGIYTEVTRDTAIRILPTTDFEGLLEETKIGTILRGVRGKKPRAIKQLQDLLTKIQQLVIDLPQITSLDINPVLVTKDRAIVVDLKLIL